VKNCEYEVDSLCTKVLVDACSNCVITINKKIVTNMVEVFKSNGCTLNINTKTGTLQIDVCKNVTLNFEEKEHFNMIVWANVSDLNIKFKDAAHHDMQTGFEQAKAVYPNAIVDFDQFYVRFVKEKLLCEQVVRLKNGFPTTEREAAEFDRRQEENLKKLAKEMGLSVGKKKRDTPKLKPNEQCYCASGKKYKKCHGMNKN